MNATVSTRLSIAEVVAETGLSENYIRKAIKSGDLKRTKEFIGESKISKNWIERADMEAWLSAKASHSRREDGRNKYVLYMLPEEQAELEKLTKKLPFLETLSRANTHKVPAEAAVETE